MCKKSKINLVYFIQNFTKINSCNELTFISISNKHEFEQLKLFSKTNEIYFDLNLDIQINELKEVFTLKYKLSEHEILEKVKNELNNDKDKFGEFIYIPWGQKTIINVLPELYLYELLTWRNKQKINDEEQALIKTKKIGVVGASVGSFATKILSKLGFIYFRLAEPKNMKPSNSSRMYEDSIRQYGKHKLKPVTESIYEYNPYTYIKTYTEGLNKTNAVEFFQGPEGNEYLDIVVDAADDGKTKLLIRDYCRKLKIPMVAGFDEKGALLIYRYDKPEILIDDKIDFTEDTLDKLKINDPYTYVLKLLDFFPGGMNNLSERQKNTIAGVKANELGGFSQLAWEASYFAGYVSKAVLDVALGELVSGSKLLDLDLEITKEMKIQKPKFDYKIA